LSYCSSLDRFAVNANAASARAFSTPGIAIR
jgi:hypothetical protein